MIRRTLRAAAARWTALASWKRKVGLILVILGTAYSSGLVLGALDHDAQVSRGLKLGMSSEEVASLAGYRPPRCPPDLPGAWGDVQTNLWSSDQDLFRRCLRNGTTSVLLVGRTRRKGGGCFVSYGESILGMNEDRVVWLVRWSGESSVEESLGCELAAREP